MSGIRIVQGQPTGNYQETIIDNSESLDFQDPVNIDANGHLKQIAAGEKVQGIFVEDRVTVASDNETVGLIKGRWAPVSEDMVLEGTADQACTQTDIGAYCDVAVSGDALTFNLAAGNSGQFEVIDFDPARDGSTTIIRVKIAERQSDAFAQA